MLGDRVENRVLLDRRHVRVAGNGRLAERDKVPRPVRERLALLNNLGEFAVVAKARSGLLERVIETLFGGGGRRECVSESE